MAHPGIEDRAFEAELVALIPNLRAFGRSLAGDPATGDDLAQEALAKAWNARASFAMGTNMKAWVFLILRNQFFSEKRRSWRSTQLDPEVVAQTLVAVTNPSGALEVDELRRAMGMLPAEQREALILIGAAGLAYEEVAEVTGVPVGTVKSRVSRARNRLAVIFAVGKIDTDGAAPDRAMQSIFSAVQTRLTQRAAA